MAFKLAELFVQITGNDRSLQATLGAVRKSVTGLGASLTRGLSGSLILGPLTSLTAGMHLAVLGLGGAMAGAAKTAIDLESQYAQLRKTTGLTGAELETLKSKLKSMSLALKGVSLDEINQIAIMAGRMGVVGAEGIAKFTEDIAKVRIALDDIPAEEAATSVARILNVFGKGTEDSIRLASALNKLDDTSTASARDILDMTRRLSGTASTIGLTIPQVLALSSALLDAGVDAEVGGTAFSGLFAKMASDAKGFAKISGLTEGAFEDLLGKDALGALQALVAGLSKFDNLSQFKMLDQMGLDGQRTAGSLLQLSKTIGTLRGNVTTANAEWQSMASIEREVAVQGETTKAKLQALWNGVVLVADAVGQEMLPSINDMAEGLSGAKGTIEELGAAFHDFLGSQTGDMIETGIGDALSGVKDTLDTLSAAMRNWDDVTELTSVRIAMQFETLKSSIKQFTEWFKQNWDQFVIGAIDATESPIENFKGLLEGGKGVVRGIGEMWEAGTDDEASIAAFKKMLDSVWGIFRDHNGNPVLPELPQIKPPDLSEFEKAIKAIEDRMTLREQDRLGPPDGGRDFEFGPVTPAKPKPEDKAKAPTKTEREKSVETLGLADFAKKLQESVFKKDDDSKTLVKQGDQMVALAREQNQKLGMAVSALRSGVVGSVGA